MRIGVPDTFSPKKSRRKDAVISARLCRRLRIGSTLRSGCRTPELNVTGLGNSRGLGTIADNFDRRADSGDVRRW
jgi:hypothetical protein